MNNSLDSVILANLLSSWSRELADSTFPAPHIIIPDTYCSTFYCYYNLPFWMKFLFLVRDFVKKKKKVTDSSATHNVFLLVTKHFWLIKRLLRCDLQSKKSTAVSNERAAYRSSGWSVNLDLHHLSLYNLRLLPVQEFHQKKNRWLSPVRGTDRL